MDYLSTGCDGSRPGLVIVDGGKPQLSAARSALADLGLDDIPVVGLAKREEEVFVPWSDEPVILPGGSASLYLVKRIRDEAHRFAIEYHRQLRGKAMTASVLDDIEGVGPKRKKALLKAFGSVKKLRDASVDEIAAVPGVSRRHGGTAFLGEDWGKFTPLDDEMRLYVGTAQDVVVKRTIDKNEQKRVAGNLFNREIVVKYEIENFKDKPVTLDIAENLRALRTEVSGGDVGRDVQWTLEEGTTLGQPDKEKSTFERLVFHVQLPARGADQKAEKKVHKLDVLLKNEW